MSRDSRRQAHAARLQRALERKRAAAVANAAKNQAKPNNDSGPRKFALSILGSNITALMAAGIYAFLSLRGFVNVTAAWIVLFLVWLLGVLGIFLSEVFWGNRSRFRISIGIVAAVGLAGVLFSLNYVVDQYTVPMTANGHPLDERLPGFGTGLMVSINDSLEARRRNEFTFRTREGAKAEFRLSANNRYVFTVTDTKGDPHDLDIPLGSNGIPFEKFVFLFCEVGTATNYSYLRVLVNGKQVARRDFDFPLDLGSRHWFPSIGGNMSLVGLAVFRTTLTDDELMAAAKNELEARGQKP